MYYIPRNCTEVKLFVITYISIISYECRHEYFFNTIFLCTKERFFIKITKVSKIKLFVLLYILTLASYVFMFII